MVPSLVFHFSRHPAGVRFRAHSNTINPWKWSKGTAERTRTRYFLGLHNFALLEKMRRFYVTDIDTATRYPYLLRVATKDPSSVRLHRLKKKVSHSAKVGTKKKVHFFCMHNIALTI